MCVGGRADGDGEAADGDAGLFASGLHIFYECFARVEWWVSGSAWLLIFCAGSSVCVSGAARMEMEGERRGMLGCLRVDYIYFMSVLRWAWQRNRRFWKGRGTWGPTVSFMAAHMLAGQVDLHVRAV